MPHYTATAPEKERRKKLHTMSKSRLRPNTPRVSPSAPNLQVQNSALAVQPVSSHHVNAPQPYWPDPIRSPRTQPVTNIQHPIYGQMPYNPSQYGLPPGHVNPTYTSPPPAIRIASPAPKKNRQDGYLKENWNKLDKMAAKSYTDLRDSACKSATKLTTDYIERPTIAAGKSMQTLCRSAALCDIISSKFDAVMTSIDNERFSGKEQDLMIYNAPSPEQQPSSTTRNQRLEHARGIAPNDAYPMLDVSDKGSNHFSKVWLYSNSRLPPYLPPFKVYLPTWPLICLAATYSERVYTPPTAKSSETETHVRSDWRSGTKAMVLKSVPVEDLNTIVFAIRGSQTFMDWAVNYNSAPTSPEHFLDDPSNLCHAGFLYVARKMIKPVAERLRKLLEENPARSNCSLLITGHSAGGAVAALIYAHMMNRTVQSDLNYLTGFFKRVHCITFGAPPVSLRPLQKSDSKRHRKSLFYSFINEGDPVPRADKNVVKSLLKLYATPMPTIGGSKVHLSNSNANAKVNANASYTSSTQTQKSKYRLPTLAPRLTRPSKSSLQSVTSSSTSSALPSWPVPECALAPAGRLVVLRQPPGSRNELDEAVEAVTVEMDALKKVVFGDPLKHQMRTYRRRIESVATRAVTARGH